MLRGVPGLLCEELSPHLTMVENSSRHRSTTASSLRVLHDVSALAPAGQRLDPDGTSMISRWVPGLHHVEVQRPIFMEP
jgi:hypothetical protein